jgi:DNA mismatch repair ATPase MutS
MSKLYDVYLEKKKDDAGKVYLFKNGNFYIMLGDDAAKLSEDLALKLTRFSKDTNKWVFHLVNLKGILNLLNC